MLFGETFFVDGHPQVLQINGYCCRQAAKPLPVLLQIVQDEHATCPHHLCSLLIRLAQHYEVGSAGWCMGHHKSMPASCLQIAALMTDFLGQHGNSRLQPVGHPEYQVQPLTAAHAVCQRQGFIERAVGIIGCTLIHHIGEETEGKRRVYTLAAAMADAHKPHQGIVQHVHLALSFCSSPARTKPPAPKDRASRARFARLGICSYKVRHFTKVAQTNHRHFLVPLAKPHQTGQHKIKPIAEKLIDKKRGELTSSMHQRLNKLKSTNKYNTCA